MDMWGSLSHLLAYFSEQVRPDAGYLSAVRARFQRWILDLCNRPYDQDWLNYHEVAKRHHSTKKNRTDGVVAAPMIHYRYMTAFIYSTTAAIKPFLAKKGTVRRTSKGWSTPGSKPSRSRLFCGPTRISGLVSFSEQGPKSRRLFCSSRISPAGGGRNTGKGILYLRTGALFLKTTGHA